MAASFGSGVGETVPAMAPILSNVAAKAGPPTPSVPSVPATTATTPATVATVFKTWAIQDPFQLMTAGAGNIAGKTAPAAREGP